MNWIQENLMVVLFVSVMVVMMFRGPVLAHFFKVRSLTVHELSALLGAKTPPLLLDVRTPAEYAAGHVPGAMLVPLQELSRARAEEIKARYANREIAVICRSGSRSAMAAVNLRRVGVATVYNVMGGTNAWQVQGYPVGK